MTSARSARLARPSSGLAPTRARASVPSAVRAGLTGGGARRPRTASGRQAGLTAEEWEAGIRRRQGARGAGRWLQPE